MQFVSPRLADQIKRRVEAYTYTDTAVYITPASVEVTDAYGQPSGTATEETIACSFTDRIPGAGSERWRGDVDIEQLAGEIRFSSETVPTKGGKIRITHIFGAEVTNKTFEIIGIQNRSQLGYVCALKAVNF